ncbi:hypothetical protein ECTW09195_2559, partial [Escherichia coli TW09195]
SGYRLNKKSAHQGASIYKLIHKSNITGREQMRC